MDQPMTLKTITSSLGVVLDGKDVSEGGYSQAN